MRATIVLILVAGCAARSELDDGDVSDARAESADGSALDAGVDVADATSDPVTPKLDAAACLALPEAACTQDPPYGSVVSGAITQCLTPSMWICGYANVSFDANGCLLGVEYYAGEIPLEFRACFETAIASQRWPCEMGQTLFAFLGSCTIN